MVKIIISGACGKMGSRILTLALQDKEIEIVGLLEARGHPSIGKTVESTGLKIIDTLHQIINQADVLVEFTNPQASIEHLTAVKEAKKCAVIGTTGFDNKQLNIIKDISRTTPVVLSPNMSVGVNLLFKLVGDIAKVVPNYDIEIVEAHHNQKKDAPSGTALKLAEEINKSLGTELKKISGREGNVGARKSNEIGIFAVRAGDIVGEHTVIFAGTGERIEVIHRAHSRDTFALGTIRAAKWIVNKSAGLYNMQDVLGLK